MSQYNCLSGLFSACDCAMSQYNWDMQAALEKLLVWTVQWVHVSIIIMIIIIFLVNSVMHTTILVLYKSCMHYDLYGIE